METDFVPQPSPATEPATLPEHAPVAPWWHTVSIIAILLTVSFMGAGAHRAEGRTAVKVANYLTTIAWQWLIFLYVWWGIRMRGGKLRDVIGGKWAHVEDVLIDIAIAVLSLFVWLFMMFLVAKALHMMDPTQVSHRIEETRKMLGFLVPRTRLEMTCWVGVSLTAGICEETLFRGYMQKQFLALSGNALIAILAQGIVFGLAHGYQGMRSMSFIALLGILFGVLSYFRKSLRPAIIAHSSFDLLQGLLLRFALK